MVSAPVLAGPHTWTDWLALPVLPVLVVKVAVFGIVLQPYCGTFTVLLYWKVVGLGSLCDTVPSGLAGASGSLTLTWSSILFWVNGMLATWAGASPAASTDPSASVCWFQVTSAPLDGRLAGSKLDASIEQVYGKMLSPEGSDGYDATPLVSTVQLVPSDRASTIPEMVTLAVLGLLTSMFPFTFTLLFEPLS